jgi:GWxTD domain-containing protein
LVALALAALAPASALAAHDEGPGPLPWHVGGSVGFTVDAASFPDSAGTRLEVYVRIPPATVLGLVSDSTGDGRLRLTVRLKTEYGAQVHESSQEFPLALHDTIGGVGKVVVTRYPVRPGRLRAWIKLEDAQSRKLKHLIRESSRVDGEIVVPGPERGAALSDIEFVWLEAEARQAGIFQQGEVAVLPDPERLYGLFQPDLRTRFQARSLGGPDRGWRWVARLLDAQGHALAVRESSAAAGRTLGGIADFDVTTLPAGGYDVEVKAWQEGDSLALVRRAHCNVAWNPDSWLDNAADFEDVVHFLLDKDTEENFGRLGPGEREAMLKEFWAKRDPTPGTGRNEAYEAFLARVDYANRTFTRIGAGKGMFSDMGRVYIRYGAPSEVYKQVIPTGDESLEAVVNELAGSQARPTNDVTDRQLRGDLSPFEIWSYDAGTGLPPDADPKVSRDYRRERPLLFLFVDEWVLGNFRLVYSTE